MICRFSLFIFAILATLQIQAQTILGSIVKDSESGEVLPFAHIYCQGRLATMSNSQGEFALVANPGDVIRITFLGHKSVSVVAGELPKVVRLKASMQYLPEVVVLPAYSLIKDITRKTAKALKKWKDEKSIYFFRQSTFVDGTQRNMMEAFFDAYCALRATSFKLITGRIAEGGDVFYGADLYKLYQQGDKNLVFQIQNKYEIRFYPNRESRFKKIVIGTLYVDTERLLPVKMLGKIENLTVVHRSIEGSIDGEVLPIDISFDVSFNIEREFPEVTSVIINSAYKDKQHDYRFLSLLYNTGRNKLDSQQKSYYIFDLRKQINKCRFSQEFWNSHETLKRTDLEKMLNDLQAEGK